MTTKQALLMLEELAKTFERQVDPPMFTPEQAANAVRMFALGFSDGKRQRRNPKRWSHK